MKKLITIVILLSGYQMQAQMGVGTTSPHSTFDVRGSFATPISTFTANTTAGIADNFLVFTGTSAATLTLPTAVGVAGREYWIKNASSNSSALTIATTSSQTVDGAASWSLTQQNKVIRLVSNGANWYATSESLPGNSSGTGWLLGGNNVSSIQNIGTTSNYALPFIVNNTERMRISTLGDVAIGTATFDPSAPEQLLVDGGSSSSINVISGKGNINSYLQLNIQNRHSGGNASSDIVATADNGTETNNYVDFGINSSGYNNAGLLGHANVGYLYSMASDFVIGNAATGKDLIFFTDGTLNSNERMRIDDAGNVGINNSTPSEKLDINGNVQFSGALMPNGSAGTSGDILVSSGAGIPPTWVSNSNYSWLVGGNAVSSQQNIGTTSNYALPFITNNTEKMRITTSGNVGIGTSTFNGSNPEKFLVDAGSGGSAFQNVIVGKGNTNSYAQLNIQNIYAGSAASSDVVATADNGNESVNFIDMGINSSAYSSTGVLAGINRAYLYATGNDFAFGNATAAKDLILFTGGTATTNERLRITSTGLVGVGNITPNSTLEVNGSVAHSITTTSSNLTLDATHYTVIITGGTPVITLPAASGCARRMYVIVNQTLLGRTISSYISFSGGTSTTVGGQSSITVQSDGTSWYRIH
jgi:hypothetical protein